MSFRLNARNLFLTYPRCGAKSLCFEFLKDKFSDCLEYLLVAEETHESGEPHLHCVIALSRKVDYKNPRCLDFEDWHGDYKAARDLDASITYCRKEDSDPLTWGDIPTGRRGRTWDVARGAESFDSFMDAVAELDYKSYVIFHDKIESFARKKFKPVANAYVDPFNDTWIANTALDGWALENVTNWLPSISVRPKSLILIGDSRLGKTAWARKHGEHVYYNGFWNVAKLDCLGPDTKYIVWDDLHNWESFNYKQWLGGQWEFDVTGKYRAPRTIRAWGRPSIVCCNELPTCLDNSWVKSNCLIVYIRFKLFQ